MDYGIGMFLAGLVSGAGIGWYVALLKVHIAYGDPEDLMRELRPMPRKARGGFDMSFSHARQSFFIISLIFAAISWLGESLVHFSILDHGQPFELIPSDSNELWMRVVICSLIVIFGIYVQTHANKKMDVEKEKMRTLKATMNTVVDAVAD